MNLSLQSRMPGPGLLALAGSGEYLPGMQPVDRWLMDWLGRPVHVVCLPTAAGTEGEARIGYWNNLGIAHFQLLGAASVQALPVIDRASASDPELAAQIHAANYVYLSGGKPTYLFETLQGTLAWAAIETVLAEGGVVVGCSAGAMIFGGHIPRNRSAFALQPAFGYLPGSVILPHFDELPGFLKGMIPVLIQRHLLVGIDGDTVLVCENGRFQVRGRGGVTLAIHNHRQRFCQGDVLPA